MILHHIHDGRVRPAARRSLDGARTVLALPLDQLDRTAVPVEDDCLFELDVTSLEDALRIHAAVMGAATSRRLIFACRPGDRSAVRQAGALGATDIVGRPVRDADLLRCLAGPAPPRPDADPASVAIGPLALDQAFGAVRHGTPIAVRPFEEVAAIVATEIDGLGLAPWIRSIRRHTSGTEQHCLVVTGLAAAFGRALDLPDEERLTLTVAALLHDIGKARIDGAILDKPGPLTEAEFATIQMHPGWGQEHLAGWSDTGRAVQDAVRHHHEALDGSGYPDGLAGREITDLTRLVTIADVFGALVEERAYKGAMTGRDAFAHLVGLARAGKLDASLVAAFRPIAATLP